jgi:hypothetical protein
MLCPEKDVSVGEISSCGTERRSDRRGGVVGSHVCISSWTTSPPLPLSISGRLISNFSSHASMRSGHSTSFSILGREDMFEKLMWVIVEFEELLMVKLERRRGGEAENIR